MKIKQGQALKGRTVDIIIDHLPDRDLSPNSRLHWEVKGRAVKVAKDEIGWLAKEKWHDDKPMMRAKISWEFHLKDHRKHDLDNLHAATKAWTDGLIEAGVIFYDDAAHLEIGSIRALVTGKEKTMVRVEEK